MGKSKQSKTRFETYPKSGKKGDLNYLKRCTVESADSAQARDLPLTDLHGRADAQQTIKKMYEKK